LLTPFYVILAFLIIGVIFIPIGAVIYVASKNVVELEFRYDNLCPVPARSDPAAATWVPSVCNGAVGLPVTVTSDMKLPVYVYYKMTNFYQNHRRYVKSRSDTQLSGDSLGDTAACDPMENEPAGGAIPLPTRGLSLYPCGLIAASYFNDDITIDITLPSGTPNDPCTPSLSTASVNTANLCWDRSSIAWASDVSTKFKPDVLYANNINTTMPTYISTSPANVFVNFNPLLGQYSANVNDTTLHALPTTDPNVDQRLMVWMRTAGLPTFKKLYAKISKLPSTTGNTIPAGTIITLRIVSKFEVASFSGQKSIVFSTTSWIGGKNDFLGIAYLVVGVLCLLLAGVFAVKHHVSPRQPGDMHFLSNWPGAAASAAAAAPTKT